MDKYSWTNDRFPLSVENLESIPAISLRFSASPPLVVASLSPPRLWQPFNILD